MLSIAVIAGTLTLAADARKRGVKTAVILDLVFWAVVGGILGARLLYIILNYSYFAANPDEVIKIQNGGLAWQGGLVVGFLATVWYIHSKKLSLPKILDLCAPYLALGQSIGRVGCYLNGCCYGKEVFWGVYFPIHNANLHPTQLYLTAGYLLIFIVLKNYHKTSAIPGLTFASYLILASTLRFIVEFFRADHSILMMGLSVYQIVSFLVFIFAIYIAFSALIKHSSEEEQ